MTASGRIFASYLRPGRHSYFYFCFSSHFSEKSYAPNRKKNNPPPKKKKIPIPSHSIWSQAHSSTDFCFQFSWDHCHISVTVQAKSVTWCGSQVRICFCPRVRTRNPFAKHSWHTGCADWNFDETSSATGRGLALPHLKQTSGKPRLLTMLLLACTIMFGSDRTSLLNSSGRFFFFFEFPPKATRAGDEKQRNKKQWPYQNPENDEHWQDTIIHVLHYLS